MGAPTLEGTPATAAGAHGRVSMTAPAAGFPRAGGPGRAPRPRPDWPAGVCWPVAKAMPAADWRALTAGVSEQVPLPAVGVRRQPPAAEGSGAEGALP